MKVAKSYEKYEKIGEPFKEKGKFYTKIDVNGKEKTVRLYTDTEYAAMYKEGTEINLNQRKVLGFGDEGYVTIFSGIDDDEHRAWLREVGARYATFFGWYLIADLPVPPVLPTGVEAKRIYWDQVGANQYSLKSKEEIDAVLSAVEVEEFAGQVGTRIELNLLVTKAHSFDGTYGTKTLFVFVDKDNYEYIWSTGAKKSFAVGTMKKLRGTIKKYQVYNNKVQCVLSNCREVK